VSRNEYERWIATVPDHVFRAWLWKHAKSLRGAEQEELIQEVRTRLLQVNEARFPEVLDEGALRSYAMGVAKHVAIDWLRGKTHAPVVHIQPEMPEVQDERLDLERGAIAQEELQGLLKAIQKMPRQRQRVVTLVKVYGYTVEEAANELGIDESTVSTHLLRARKEYAEQLQAQEVPETIHLLGRLFKQIGLGKGRRPSMRRKIIDSEE